MNTKSLYFPGNKKPIFCGNRVVGNVNGDVFEKYITGSKHLLRIPPAIAFDISTLDDAERAGAVWAKVKDRETGNIYRAKIQDIRDKGIWLERGFGNQKYLPLSYWSINGNPPSAGSPVAAKSKPLSTQPQLF